MSIFSFYILSNGGLRDLFYKATPFNRTARKFFPVSRVEIVLFPEGCLKNPSNMIEAPVIEGPVPEMIDRTMSYLETNVIKEQIIKPKNDLRSIRFYNYPYQALEEAVANALYHRDYQEREPIEITIEPDKITILSFSGPDRSVTLDAIKKGDRLYTRRYRNRRLGDFLKELEYTEGHSTGIPTMQRELEANGSPKAVFETDEGRTYFTTTIYVHPKFENKNFLNDIREEEDVPQNGTQNGTQIYTKLQNNIIAAMKENPKVTLANLGKITGTSRRTVARELKKMPSVQFVGPSKTGHWEILDNYDINPYIQQEK